jgi:hypothetical protein
VRLRRREGNWQTISQTPFSCWERRLSLMSLAYSAIYPAMARNDELEPRHKSPILFHFLIDCGPAAHSFNRSRQSYAAIFIFHFSGRFDS